MNLPPTIEIRAKCGEPENLADIIFTFEISSGTKNPFRITFPKTSPDGLEKMAADTFRGQFENHFEMGLMDYNGTIESAADVVGVELLDIEQMRLHRKVLAAWPLSKREKSIWKRRAEFLNYHLSCRNETFDFARALLRIPNDGVITLHLRRRS